MMYFLDFCLTMIRSARFRLSPDPTAHLPLNVRSSGFSTQNASEDYTRVPARFIQLFWCLRGVGTAVFSKEKIRLKPGSLIFYFSGEAHLIKPLSSDLGWHWITFDGTQTRAVLKAFGLKRYQIPGACPARLFRKLELALQDATDRGEREASLIAYEILLAAASPGSSSLPARQERSISHARDILDERFAEAQLNITAVACELGIHRSTFYRLFQLRYGVSPIQYLFRLRVNQALGLLKETSLSLSEIAAQTGHSDSAYLSRVVKAATGHSPREFRRL